MIKKHAISLFDSKTLKDITFILGKVAKVEKLYILSSYKEWMEEDYFNHYEKRSRFSKNLFKILKSLLYES